MKNKITICLAIFISVSGILPQQANAQAPEKMSYQAVVRDARNVLVLSIGIKISILQGSSSGTAVYTETQTPTTNFIDQVK